VLLMLQKMTTGAWWAAQANAFIAFMPTTAFFLCLALHIVDVCHLDVASFGAWDDAQAETAAGVRADRPAYRKLLWRGERLTGAIILGPSSDIWTTNDVGMLKGLVQSGVGLERWKAHLKANPFDIKPAFIATKTTSALLPETILGRPSKAPGETPVAV